MVAPVNIFRGDSPPIAKVLKLTPANVVAGDTFNVSCNGKTVSYVAQASTATDVVNGLVAALSATSIAEFTEFLASATLGATPGPSDGSFITLTAANAGTPFAVTTSTVAVGSVSVTESTPGKFGVNEVHQISLVGTYTGGTFTITYSFGTTAAIAYNASAATVQAAIAALAGVGAGQVIVTGGPGPNSPWFVEWTGTLAAQSIAVGTINGTSLTGNGSATVTEATRGNGNSDDIQFLDCSVAGSQQNPTFTLTLDGQTTTAINVNGTAAAIQAALQALPNVGSGNCLVYGAAAQNGGPSTFAIHFTGALAGMHVSQLVVGGYISGFGSAPIVTTLQNGGLTTSDDFQWIDLGMAGTAAGTGGTPVSFTVAFGGQATAITTNVEGSSPTAAQQLQAKLQAMSTIGANNCTVYGPSYTGGTSQVTNGFLVRFTGAKANTNQGNLTVNSTTGTPVITRLSYGHADVNEVQQITIFGTGGTFTLTAGAQTTSAIAFNAATGTIQTRIQTDLSATFTAVTVTGSGTLASPWVVTVTNPANTPIAVMTGNGASLTGGGGTIVEQAAGAAGVSEVQTATVIAGATGGTFTLAFNGAVTSNLAWNAAAATVQTALRALATINTVSVAGSAGGPYTITWSGAQGNAPQNLIVGNGALLTGQTGNQTLTQATTIFSSGPLHYDDPLNWTLGNVPNSGDAVYFDPGTGNCLYGLDQISTFTWATGPNLGTWTKAALQNNQSVYLTTTNTLPAGLAANTLYYIVNANRDAGTFQLAATLGGTPIVVTTTGTGVHTIGVRLASLEVDSRFTGQIGLSRTNSLGYYEYRALYLHIGLATVAQGGASCTQTVSIGTESGGGSGKIQLDTDVDQTILKIINTSGSIEANLPAMLWKGQNAANTLNLVAGDLGIAMFPGETAQLAGPLIQRGGSLELGQGLTLTGTIDKVGGTLIMDGCTINGSLLVR